MRNAPRTAICVLTFLFSLCPCALALNPALDVSQYAHTAWRFREGFESSHVNAIAQTSDGYLWLGTDRGLLRFDGVRTTPWQPPTAASLLHTKVSSLMVARDGSLWIGTSGGLSSWNHGGLRTHPQLEGFVILALFEDREGTVWVGANAPGGGLGALCAIRSDMSECHGSDGRFGPGVAALAEDTDGSLWAVSTTGLWRAEKHGRLESYRLSEPVILRTHSLIAAGTQGVLLFTKQGVGQIIDGKLKDYWIAPMFVQWNPDSLFRDRDGALWIGTLNRGLFHFHEGRIDEFGRADGLSDDHVLSTFEDREGNIWVATLGGLDRFRALSATTYSERQGVTGFPASVLADRDGSIWFSTSDGLYRWNVDHFDLYRGSHGNSPGTTQEAVTSALVREVPVAGLPDTPSGSLFQDHRRRVWLGTEKGLGYLDRNRFVTVDGVPRGYIDSIVEDPDGNLWLAHRDAGLLEFASDRLVRQVPWTTIHPKPSASRLAVDPVRGGLWLGFFSGGIVHFVGGHVDAAYENRDGLTKGQVNDLWIAPDGALWVATDGGVSRLKEGRIATLDTRAGLPCDLVDSLVFDDESLWLYSACGLVRVLTTERRSWDTALLQGNRLESKVRTTVLDMTEGIAEFATISTFRPHIARTSDGRLWIVSNEGLTVVDPHHLPLNRLPPPIHIERVTADREPYQADKPVSLPPRVHDLEIGYTALSLVAPEKVTFRYKLEGRENDWRDAGNRRRAFYTDLPPGRYRFRVIASNNSGVWNEQGASLDLSIAPAYWQTNWFRALCALVLVALLWFLYQLRVRQLTQAFQRTLDARVSERTRIARELHDTLLQSLQGLLLRFRTVQTLIPTAPGEAQEVLESAIEQARAAVTESRSTVQGLRVSNYETSDLTEAIRTLGKALASDPAYSSSVALTLNIEGTPRALQPVVRDEVYRTASEALRNAYRHANASQIEVQLDYGERHFELRVRDDGKGIDPKVMGGEALPGHFGLSGMRERAKEIGAKLTIWSGPSSGTEVQLSIPAAVAYERSPRAPHSWLTGRFFGARRAPRS